MKFYYKYYYLNIYHNYSEIYIFITNLNIFFAKYLIVK